MMAAPPNVYDNENVFSAFLSRSLLLLLFVGGILLFGKHCVHFYKKSSNVFPLIFPIKPMRIARAFNPTMKQRSNLYDGEYFEIIDNTGNGKSVIVQCNLCKVENNPKLHIRKCLTSNGNVFKHVEVSGFDFTAYLWFTDPNFFRIIIRECWTKSKRKRTCVRSAIRQSKKSRNWRKSKKYVSAPVHKPGSRLCRAVVHSVLLIFRRK